ncbi:MAG: ATP-binding cassette domain-containing protein, partial [Spirochaetota bacterium]
RKGMLDMKKAVQLTQEISEKYRLSLDPLIKVENLSVAQKQKVEILKALLRGAQILILDEPTAVLTPQETEELFIQLEILKNNGHTLVFISHKLNEVKQVCDRITVLRGGKFIATMREADVTKKEISRLMVGREVSMEVEKAAAIPQEVILSVEHLSYRKQTKAVLQDIHFSVRAGEILGIAGVEGNGQEELVNIIVGLLELQQGRVRVRGTDIKNLTVRRIRERGLSHIPEDRIESGVVVQASIQENLIADRYYKKEYNHHYFLLRSRKIAEDCRDLVQQYDIKCSSADQSIKNLSGGNMQKAVIAREISQAPQLLIANQPTRGVDVGSAEFIYQKIIAIRDSGSALLLLSSDLNEVLQLSDRLIVLHNGSIACHLENPQNCADDELGQYMLGLKKQNENEVAKAFV